MDLREAEAWLESLINFERQPDLRRARFSLEPVRRLLARLGDPQQGLSVLHVAGSKGKGSTALFAEALLRGAGRRVATFTSPHLARWTERFRVDGGEVSGERLAEAVSALRPHVDALRGEPDAPTWFDVTTAAALWLFAREGVDHAVLEVGLGGRLDSTNAVMPALCVLASVELEHTDKLGTTLAAIAGEKAGILKPGVPALVGELPAEAAEAVAARAAAVGAPLLRAGRDFGGDVLADHGLEGCAARLWDGPLEATLRLATPGRHQVANAALAFAAAHRLAAAIDDARWPELAARALEGLRLPGRIEVLARRPLLVVDGAHTAVSVRALAEVLAATPRRRCHVVLSVSAGKDLGAIGRALAPLADDITVTRADPIRSLTPQEVAAAVRAIAPQAALRVVPNPHLALRAARAGAGDEDLVCATGSVYLAGIARRVFGEEGGDGAG